jgi:hypothetical protein
VDFYDGWTSTEATDAIEVAEQALDPRVHRQGEGFADGKVWLG